MGKHKLEITEDKNFFWSRVLSLAFLAGVVVISRFSSQAWMGNLTKHNLPLHMILEMIGILVSFSVFTVGWATYKNVRSTDILVLSLVCFMVGWLDLGHTLSFTGMPDFVTPSGPDKAIYFWLVSRLTGAFGFLFISQSRPSEFKSKSASLLMFIAAVTWVGAWYWVILYHQDRLPIMFTTAGGLTNLKLGLEWLAVAIAGLSAVLLFRQAMLRNLVNIHWLGSASFIFALTGYFFTMYSNFDDLYNFAGHIYKAVAFLLVYRAVFMECVDKPFLEIQKSAKQALEANISKSRFLANVSHEFRTPLGVIAGFSDLLTESPSLDSESRKWSQTISRNAKQLRALIDDLLDLAKAESEKISVQWLPFSIVDAIDEVVCSLKLQAEKKGVSINFETEIPATEMVISDRMRFCQILLNLIGNAVKFTSVGQVAVGLRLNSRTGKYEISIKDSGLGIHTSQVSRLFQPFAQANDPSSRRFGGTGLGLALSKKLTTLLGGDLWLEKSEIGKGSEFIFTIKNQKSEQVVIEKAKTPIADTVAHFDDLRILAAEDSIDNQSLLKLYLKPTGAHMKFANNGAEAVKMVDQEGYDLILMDIQMPEMDGFEAVEKLRQKHWNGPILALSAHAHEPEKNRALSSGFDGYLVKPITREKLWESIAHFTHHELQH